MDLFLPAYKFVKIETMVIVYDDEIKIIIPTILTITNKCVDVR